MSQEICQPKHTASHRRDDAGKREQQRHRHHSAIVRGRVVILRHLILWRPREEAQSHLSVQLELECSFDYPKCNSTSKLRFNPPQAVLVYVAF